MRYLIIIMIACGVVVAVFLVATSTPGWYQSPLLDTSARNPLEIVCDFFGFSWHYSCHIWKDRSRHWKEANRQKLLAFWYRPGYAGFKDLREKSFLELGYLYERLALPLRASEMFLQACRQEPENRWLVRRAGSKMIEMKQWDKLDELCRLLLEKNRLDPQARRWLEISGSGAPIDKTPLEQADEN